MKIDKDSTEFYYEFRITNYEYDKCIKYVKRIKKLKVKSINFTVLYNTGTFTIISEREIFEDLKKILNDVKKCEYVQIITSIKNKKGILKGKNNEV